MRPLATILVVLTAVILTLVQLRGHIRDLYQVARTYRTFYPFLRDHPDVLYRYSAAGLSTDVFLSEDELVVPRRIHQVFLQEGRTSTMNKYAAAIHSCQQSGWNHTIWTDKTGTAFMRDHYPTLYPHYIGYKQSIQRANILRYALLDHYGGVYVDLDVTCRSPLDDLRERNIPFLTPGAHPAGVNNAFIMSRPRHPFLRRLLDLAPSRDLYWGLPYVENMLSTGCGYFGSMWTSYTQASPRLPDDVVRILADENGDIAPHMLRGITTTPLFKHGGASSWHGWDAAAIVMIGKYLYTPVILPLFGLLGCVTALGAWKLTLGRTRRRRRSWGARVNEAVSPSLRGQDEKKDFLATIDEESQTDGEQAIV